MTKEKKLEMVVWHQNTLYCIYSRTRLERPPLLPSKSGLSRQVVSYNRNENHIVSCIHANENGRSRREVTHDRGRTRQVILYYTLHVLR